MASARYLLIDSSYRDRNQYPLPGNFEVPISQSGMKTNGVEALDPVSDSTPIIAWSGQHFISTGGLELSGFIQTSQVGVDTIQAMSGPKTFLVVTTDPPQQLIDYYSGAVIRASTETSVEYRRILNSRFVRSTDDGGLVYFTEITVEFPFGSIFDNGIAFKIVDPTEIGNVGDNPLNIPAVFVPSGRDTNNGYPNYVLYNESVRDWRTITNYDSVTHLLSIDISSGNVLTWTNGDNYSIRRKPPISVGPIVTATASSVTLVGTSVENNYYAGSFIRVPATATETYDYGSITAPVGEVRRIVSYNGATKVAILSQPFTASPTTLTDPLYVEILPFTKDNFSPFVYTGTYTSNQESSSYEVILSSLILPNDILAVGIGSRIAFYPYVVVELIASNSADGVSSNSIYSNNPNIQKASFYVPIDDIQDPNLAPFINLDSRFMPQTVKFKPNQNFHFVVRLPNGEVFDTKTTERYSPSYPNPIKQITACFSMRKL